MFDGKFDSGCILLAATYNVNTPVKLMHQLTR